MVGKTYFEQSLYLEQFDFELKQRTENQFKHLKCLITLNKELDWVHVMERQLKLEASQREKEVELTRTVTKECPISAEKMSTFEFIAYTDGACSKKHGDPIGSAAFILYDQDQNIVAS